MPLMRYCLFLLFAFVIVSPLNTSLATEAEGTEPWNEIRQFLFQDRNIQDGSEFLRLDVPVRLPHGAKVRVAISSSHPQDEEQYITKYYLVVDKNPSPIAAVFDFPSHNSDANVATDIRISEYSNVRVISENQKGELYMTSTYVKVSGGCSLPPANYSSMGEFEIGKMSFSEVKKPASKQSGQFKVSILHPSYSGMQKDQIKLYFIPPHYVENVEVRNGRGDVILSVAGDISFSEDPSFSFSYEPISNDDALTVKIMDSKKQSYQSTWPVLSSDYSLTVGQ